MPEIFTIDSSIDNLNISNRTRHFLHHFGVNKISNLINCDWRDLFEKYRISQRGIENIVQELDSNGFRLKDCSYEKYPKVDDYISMYERIIRTSHIDTFEVHVFPPEKGNYSKGGDGYTIFFNIINQTDSPLKLKIEESGVYSHGRQWNSDYYYTGYSINNEYIFPETPRTGGKIWITNGTSYSSLVNGDYLTLLFSSVDTSKLYFYKFVLRQDNSWNLEDYYELDN